MELKLFGYVSVTNGSWLLYITVTCLEYVGCACSVSARSVILVEAVSFAAPYLSMYIMCYK